MTRLLDSGAHGDVFLSADGNVVLKCFKVNVNGQDSRFENELQLLSTFSHPSIVKLIAVQDQPDPQYLPQCLALEYIPRNLSQLISQKVKVYDMLIADIANGLAYLHASHVVHCDLKPANVLITSDNRAKICDFGLSKVSKHGNINFKNKYQEDSGPLITEYMCTRHYRSIEVLLTYDHYTEAIDLWAFGCLIYESVTSSVLFPGDSNVHMIQLIVDELGSVPQNVQQQVQHPKARSLVQSFDSSQASFKKLSQLDDQWLPVVKGLLMLDPSQRLKARDVAFNLGLLIEVSPVNTQHLRKKRLPSNIQTTPIRKTSPWDVESARQYLTSIDSGSPLSEPSLTSSE